jgi:type II secretory pathway component PulM
LAGHGRSWRNKRLIGTLSAFLHSAGRYVTFQRSKTMARDEQLRKNLARLSRIKDTVEDSLRHAAEQAGAKNNGKRNVNVSTRVNKAVVTNIGQPNSVEGASSRQSVKITQTPEGTRETSETNSVQFSQPRPDS